MKRGIFSWVMGNVHDLACSIAARQMQTVACQPVARGEHCGAPCITECLRLTPVVIYFVATSGTTLNSNLWRRQFMVLM